MYSEGVASYPRDPNSDPHIKPYGTSFTSVTGASYCHEANRRLSVMDSSYFNIYFENNFTTLRPRFRQHIFQSFLASTTLFNICRSHCTHCHLYSCHSGIALLVLNSIFVRLYPFTHRPARQPLLRAQFSPPSATVSVYHGSRQFRHPASPTSSCGTAFGHNTAQIREKESFETRGGQRFTALTSPVGNVQPPHLYP